MMETFLLSRLFLPGERIVCQGEEGDSCFILQHGEAEASKGGVAVKSFQPGSIFGEFVMLGLTEKREATVAAVSVCLVLELQQQKLLAALKAFPDEVQIFQELALAHLKDTVPTAMQQLPFFTGGDMRFITLMVMNVHCACVPPGNWLGTDPSLGSEGLVLVNRGTVDIWKDGFEISSIHQGEYLGATVALGLHRTHPFQYKTRTMCHLIMLDSAVLLTAVEQYHLALPWLQACRKREELEFQDLCRNIRERLQKVRLQKHLKRHLGKLFPHMRRIFLGFDSRTTRLQMAFRSWAGVCRDRRQRRRAIEVLNKATADGLPRIAPGFPRHKKHLPSNPTPVEMLRTPLRSSTPMEEKIPVKKTKCPWHNEIHVLMHSQNCKQLYSPRTPQWETSYSQFRAPGIPSLPRLPERKEGEIEAANQLLHLSSARCNSSRWK